MTELIRTWIMGLVAASFLSAIALTLCPKGRIRSIVGLTAGLVTVVALVAPILDFDPEAHDLNLERFAFQLDTRIEEIEREQERLRTLIISDRSRTYIWDKAQSIGAYELDIQVETRRSPDGAVYPYGVRLIGSITSEQQEILERYLSDTFGITAERQQWSERDDEQIEP